MSLLSEGNKNKLLKEKKETKYCCCSQWFRKPYKYDVHIKQCDIYKKVQMKDNHRKVVED